MARPMTRWTAYAGVSTALAVGVVVKAFAQRPNFYSAAVYLSQSSANLMILTNMLFVAACTFLLGLQKLLYGPLRPIEIEQLYDKAWLAVLETCLAMAMFRGEIGAWFLVMFFALLAGKVWAWIGEGRVEILEQQPPRNPRLFHTRLALSLGLSVVFNLSMLEFVVKEVMQMARPDMMVTFGFEFAVLSIVSLSTAARYAINLSEIAIVQKQKNQRIAEIRKERVQNAIRAVMDASTEQVPGSTEARAEQEADRATGTVHSVTAAAASAAQDAARQPVDDAEVEVDGWEDKGRWVFYLDLLTDFLKLVVYLAFFVILLIFYGLPIQILREVFMTCKSFVKRITDFVRYRNATRDMNDRYPDATEQDIGREDVCIICREEMRPYQPTPAGQPRNPAAERMRPKKLPCGHILHFSCLRSWLERQQICPTCRTSVTPTNQAQPGQANGAGGQAQGGQHPAAAGGGGRAGVVRLGPLRIAFGAARGGNMLGDLQNRLRDGGDQAAQPGNPNPNANANANRAQQYGFGIRWDGMRRRERSRGLRSIQDQLNAAERQIQQELQNIGGSLAELQVLRNMEAELARIRAQRAAASAPQASSSARTTTGPALGAGVATQSLLVGDAAGRLGHDHPNLPPGLTLPEGWTMMPLTPASGSHQTLPIPGHPMFQQGQMGTNFLTPGRPPFSNGGLTTMQSSPQAQPIQSQQQASGTRDGSVTHAEPNHDLSTARTSESQDVSVNASVHVPVQPPSQLSSSTSTTGTTQGTLPDTVSAQTTINETSDAVSSTLPLPNWGSGASATSSTSSASTTEQVSHPVRGERQENNDRTPPRPSVHATPSDSEDSSSSDSEAAPRSAAKQRPPTVEDDDSE